MNPPKDHLVCGDVKLLLDLKSPCYVSPEYAELFISECEGLADLKGVLPLSPVADWQECAASSLLNQLTQDLVAAQKENYCCKSPVMNYRVNLYLTTTVS